MRLEGDFIYLNPKNPVIGINGTENMVNCFIFM